MNSEYYHNLISSTTSEPMINKLIPIKNYNPIKSKVFIINGVPCSGKDQFVKECDEILTKLKGQMCCWNYSTIDYVKEIAKSNGWDGEKTLEVRAFFLI